MNAPELSVHQVIASLDNPCAGTTIFVQELIAALRLQGVTATAFSVEARSQGEHHRACLPDSSWLASKLRSSAALERGLGAAPRPQILHAHGLWLSPSHTAAKIAAQARIPLVLSPHGMLAPWALRPHPLRKKLLWHLREGRLLSSADALHVTSSQEAEECRALGLKQKLLLLPVGVHVSPLLFQGSRRKRLVFLGRLHRVKGVEMLAEVWSRLAEKFPEWTLCLAGPDEDGSGARAEELMRGRGTPRFEFCGPVLGQAKTQLLSESALFVLPSFTENFGLAVAEALAHGMPVLTTTATPWQQLERLGAGWCVQATPEALEAGLVTALSTAEEELASMGQRGRSWVEAQLSWRRVATDFERAYRWLLAPSSACPDFILR